MLRLLKKNFVSVILSLWSLVLALFWLALRVNWSGISKFLGADTNQSFIIMQSPLMVCILLWVLFILNILAMFFLRDRISPKVASLIVSSVFTALIYVVVVMGAVDYLYFILPKFFRSFAVSLAIIILACLLFIPSEESGRAATAVKAMCFTLVLFFTVVIGYGITFRSCFTYGAVVYAVEDDYQIVFSTNDKAIAWVEIGEEKYYDLYAGSMKSEDKVHKITVPQEALDEAKGYSIHAQKMIYRGPFGGYLGKEIEESYSFKPVDSSDGLVYYSMSDVHHSREGAVNAALSVKDLDFLVMLGDNTGMVDREEDAQFANLLAHDVTGGEIPVVYARGNHEIKGFYAEELYKYVGSENGNFYYWFTLSDVFGITLDIGEDHDDDWWEYYGTAKFELYQKEQSEMLEELIEAKPYEDYSYTLVACHIPIQLINNKYNHSYIKTNWTALLNEIKPDLALYGHHHELIPLLADQEVLHTSSGKLVYSSQYSGIPDKPYGGMMTDYEFDGFIVGRPGLAQKDKVDSFDTKSHVGLVTRVDLVLGKQTCSYINSNGEAVKVVNPFTIDPPKTVFELNLR